MIDTKKEPLLAIKPPLHHPLFIISVIYGEYIKEYSIYLPNLIDLD